jgi:hypothetical protein
LLAVFVCGPLAAFSKENGVLLYPLLLLIEATLFRFEAGYRLSRKGLVALHAITVALPAALALLSLALAPGFLLGGYRFSRNDSTTRRGRWFGSIANHCDHSLTNLGGSQLARSCSAF